MTSSGKVFLVGAGPGAVDLLTIRAMEVLNSSDIVLFDRLISKEMLEIIPDHVQKIYVGKEQEESSRSRQDKIHQLLIFHARQGRNVVRLKSGDPFVFGRGGEEMLAMQKENIPVEIVPGLTTCVSVPTLAGFPVTHRGVNTSFSVFTGHEGESDESSGIDWDLATLSPTSVFLMGVHKLPRIIQEIVQRGKPLDTPIAIFENGSLPESRLLLSTLEKISNHFEQLQSPAVIVIGEIIDFFQQNGQALVPCEILE